ncbi:MobA/MobL family protein [Azospirillum sp. TSO35-2]|uniref:MobA/MobL family protein n=1 Tax=Azospirillum sp. TSO35-2 TaxID=716796 RepID=UPI000D65E1D4|nr:MobA/MobL family protein [Azospirillum sp. TSO35-2]
MALYSLRHTVISNAKLGSSGLTAARLVYACRRGAVVLEARTGLATLKRASLNRFASERERTAGRNGRVMECIIIALPLEASPDQHRALVVAYAERLTQGQAPWIAALHYDRPGNPHVHLYAFDQGVPRKAGQRGRTPKVMGLSRDGALEEVRTLWAEVHNAHMAAWGYGPAARIDHRSLAAQGIVRLPTLHEGPKSRAMAARGIGPTSRARAGPTGREIRWPEIDGGTPRCETNALVGALNNRQETALHGRPDHFPAALSGSRHEDPRSDFVDGSACPSSVRSDKPRCRPRHEDTRGDARAAGRSGGGAGQAAEAGAAVAAALVDDGTGDRNRPAGRRRPRHALRLRGLYRPDRLRLLLAQVAAPIRAALASVDWRRVLGGRGLRLPAQAGQLSGRLSTPDRERGWERER